jgi:2-aminoethylphosphonate-pyruvate transaminase
MHADNLILLTPGPVRTSVGVRQAMARTDIGHRDSAFVALLTNIRAGLKRLGDAPDHDALLLGGGGTAAVEAALSTFIAPEEKFLVISNGAFGERLAEIAGILGVAVVHLKYDWGAAIPLNDIEQALAADTSIRAVGMIHHETSTGQINPVKAVGKICAWHKALFLVDTVSSFGAEEFSATAANVAIVVSSANKCLHGVPGVSFLLVHKDCWSRAASIKPRSMYLDLRRYLSAASTTGQTPFTPPVQALMALNQAIIELEQDGGPAARKMSYQALNTQLRAGLADLGLRAHYDAASASTSVILADLPKDRTFAEFYNAMRNRGFLVYDTKGPLHDKCFLIANMGTLDSGMIEAFLAALAKEIQTKTRASAIVKS